MTANALRGIWLLLAVAGPGLPAALRGQDDPAVLEKLRADQDGILRKAERLQSLMQRLQQRYQRENKPEQVKLLAEGLAHLERSGILRDIASIRDDLAATALTEALRKQKDVVDDLERLLAILLERNSIENLQQELARIEAEAKTARALAARQQELMERTEQTMRTPPSPAEQALLDRLAELRNQERSEAERNMRQAGARRPFLESALQRVRELLDDQQQLDQGLADEAAGRTSAARAAEFDLGELTQRVKELAGDLRDQARTQALGDSARELQKQAAGADQEALRQARDRLQAGLQQAPKRAAGPEGKASDPEWAALKQRLQQAGEGATQSERDAMQQVGQAGSELASQRDQEARGQNAAAGESLAEAAAKVAARMRDNAGRRDGQPDAKADPASAVDEAKQALAEAGTASKQGDVAAAQKKVSEAMQALDRARQEHQRQNPDAERKAAEMAAEAESTAQELHNAPAGEAAEQTAGEQLEQAAKALRDVVAKGDQAEADPKDGARARSAATSKQALQEAERTLQQALQQAGQGSRDEMQAAAARQQALSEAAKAAEQQMQQAAQQGQLTKAQAEQAQKGLQQAQNRMQAASDKLQNGQQAGAAAEQQQAAQALDQAMQGLDQKRPPTADQQQQLQQQAKAQQQLTEDIIRLAKEMKERDNKQAQRKVEAAAEAAKKAQQAMEQGDPDETQQQQDEARKNLEEAADELEEEKDRYQDLRQEELLFRMKDELVQFLDRQRPITAQTVEAQQSLATEGLARAVRIKMNRLGEEEQELSGKLDFLVAALTEEGNLVYQTVLKANVQDLQEVARRLTGRNPDVGKFTTLLQQDVERRSEELLKALERERQRRDQERKDRQQQQQQQQDKGRNRFDPQRQKLVGLIAELEMLKQLGIDTRTAADNLRALVEARGDEVISDAEVTMIERLANRHGEITRLFQQIKAGVEATLQNMEGNQEEQGGGRGR